MQGQPTESFPRAASCAGNFEDALDEFQEYNRLMAWIEQTKKGSRRSGGPQYYLQGLTEAVQAALEALERCPIRLWTPYGVVESGLEAVSSSIGSVGHDRV